VYSEKVELELHSFVGTCVMSLKADIRAYTYRRAIFCGRKVILIATEAYFRSGRMVDWVLSPTLRTHNDPISLTMIPEPPIQQILVLRIERWLTLVAENLKAL
jgi:hypothetical protein